MAVNNPAVYDDPVLGLDETKKIFSALTSFSTFRFLGRLKDPNRSNGGRFTTTLTASDANSSNCLRSSSGGASLTVVSSSNSADPQTRVIMDLLDSLNVDMALFK